MNKDIDKISNDEMEEAMNIMITNRQEQKLQDKKPHNNKIYKYNRDENENYTTVNCKVCNLTFMISSKYDGSFPLCYKHRNPNDRLNIKKI
jgi:hypothetical protein